VDTTARLTIRWRIHIETGVFWWVGLLSSSIGLQVPTFQYMYTRYYKLTVPNPFQFRMFKHGKKKKKKKITGKSITNGYYHSASKLVDIL
jgi:hypothetical protein